MRLYHGTNLDIDEITLTKKTWKNNTTGTVKIDFLKEI